VSGNVTSRDQQFNACEVELQSLLPTIRAKELVKKHKVCFSSLLKCMNSNPVNIVETFFVYFQNQDSLVLFQRLQTSLLPGAIVDAPGNNLPPGVDIGEVPPVDGGSSAQSHLKNNENIKRNERMNSAKTQQHCKPAAILFKIKLAKMH